jgi:uncharacterized protein YqgV (UPF0045/DUF77 family)
MITKQQRKEATILLNNLKILINEAAILKDSKEMYTTIETGIDDGVAAAIAAAEEAGGTATPPEPFVEISTTWYEGKIQALTSEINKVLQQINIQLINNI